MAALTHIALWTTQLETLRDFYVRYFNGMSNEKYEGVSKCTPSFFMHKAPTFTSWGFVIT